MIKDYKYYKNMARKNDIVIRNTIGYLEKIKTKIKDDNQDYIDVAIIYLKLMLTESKVWNKERFKS